MPSTEPEDDHPASYSNVRTSHDYVTLSPPTCRLDDSRRDPPLPYYAPVIRWPVLV